MGELSSIAWTKGTINVWHGCAKVSQGCAHCYAETQTPIRVKRAAGLETWGPRAARSETKSWRSDLRAWARSAVTAANVEPWRVFGQSLSDVFEDYQGGRVVLADGTEEPNLDGLRAKFFAAIDAWEARTLTFQILTKRPENVLRMVPASWLTAWPGHVWIGTTAEDQAACNERIPHLLRVPAAVRFLSIEPQIGPVNLGHWYDARTASMPFDWIICGGESGPRARPFNLAWARSLRDQCKAAGVPFFMKQLGAYPITKMTHEPGLVCVERLDDVGARIVGQGWRALLGDSHGGDESEWPPDLRGCRAFPVRG